MSRPIVAEGLGTAILLYVIVGDAFMAEGLGTDPTSQLLAQAIAVGLALGVAIAVLQPISGSHFNPSVTLGFWRSGTLTGTQAVRYVSAQLLGAVSGVVAANLTFGRSAVSISEVGRGGFGLVGAEAIATFVLVLVILVLVRSNRASAVPVAVGAWVSAIVFATSSTGFANPVVAIARIFTDGGAGIAASSVLAFVVVQLAAGLAATSLATFLVPQSTAQPART